MGAFALAGCAGGDGGSSRDAQQLELLEDAQRPAQLGEGLDGGASADDASEGVDAGPKPFVSFADPERTLNVVAHQDDDIGLMSPNLLNTIRSGHRVQTIYLTDGSAGLPCSEYALSRVDGMHAAYAKMAGVPNAWTPLREVVVNGKTLLETELVGAPIKLMFVGFTNPALDGTSFLSSLWNGTFPVIETSMVDSRKVVDGYTREQLIETLRVLITQFSPSHVNVLDGSELQPPVWPFDHNEHISSALFAIAALQRTELRPTVRMHRGYNMQTTAPPNVSKDEAALKHDVWVAYSPFDEKICGDEQLARITLCGVSLWCDPPSVLYVGYEERQYPIGLLQRAQGGIITPSGACLAASSDGASVQSVTCDLSQPTQHWAAQRDGTLQHLVTGRCMTEQLAQDVRRVVLQPCDAAQRIKQQFFLTGQGQLRGPDASCVQTDGSQLRVVRCGWLDNQVGFLVGYAGTPQRVSSAARAPLSAPLLLPTLRPGERHMCERRSDGVWCAVYRKETGAFDEPFHATAHFNDGQGFGAAGVGALQFGDIDGDGLGDVCATGSDGVYCARVDRAGRSFVGFMRVLQGGIKKFGAGNTLRLIDVDGDKLADLCARTSAGLECAHALGTGEFDPPTLRTAAFSDMAGFDADARASTVQFGDINGDGSLDVCMRSATGVRCALNRGDGQFVLDHLFSQPGELTDQAGYTTPPLYGSLRLRDIDGDGRADLCAVLTNNVRCGTSTGTTFGALLAALPVHPLFDGVLRAEGAASLGIADLDGDGRNEMCLRARDGVYCAFGVPL